MARVTLVKHGKLTEAGLRLATALELAQQHTPTDGAVRTLHMDYEHARNWAQVIAEAPDGVVIQAANALAVELAEGPEAEALEGAADAVKRALQALDDVAATLQGQGDL
jgi:dTDP-4-dehydrorhamnose reductase